MKMEEARAIYLITKKQPFWKRWKCNHDYLYIGIRDGIYKMEFCRKCGKEKYY